MLLLQGGASLQFSMVPMNLMTSGRAAYAVTGEWSQRAVKEAQRHGTVQIAASTEAEHFCRVPRADEVQVEPGADYLHFTTNNTIYGTQWPGEPPAGGAPLVADMSSDFLSRPIAIDRYAVIYAGAQKNLGPAGATVAMPAQGPARRRRPRAATMLSYRTHAEAKSLYNTPTCWAITSPSSC